MVSPRLSAWRRAFVVVALFSLVFPTLSARASSGRSDFDETVLSCEEALAKLQRCCPDFDPMRVDCVDDKVDNTGCGFHTYGRVLPAYTQAESTCIREMPCDALVNKGVCKRAQAIMRRGQTWSEDLDTGSTTTKNDDKQPAVCP